MKKFIKEYWEKFKTEVKKNFQDLKSIKTAYKQVPNILTISRLLATIPINLLFLTGNFTASLVTCGIAALTDLVDGPFARKFNCNSEFGAELDAICDKLFILFMALPIVIQNPFMILNLGLEIGIIGTNVKAAKAGKHIKTEFVGKAKTAVLSATVLLGYFLPILNINPNILASLLITLPAAAFQTATLNTYININKNQTKPTEKKEEPKVTLVEIKKENKEQKKTIQKEYTKLSLFEELLQERERLLSEQEEKGHQKIKTDLK